MDDVDAVQAQIARNMLSSGDWVIARLDGVPYLEKSPLVYWLMAISYRVFGVHDWAARIPIALAAVLLAWFTYRYGRWAFGERGGYYAGIVLATCVGLFLFTRILIPDVMLTLSTCLTFWAFQRATDPEEPQSRLWAAVLAASLGIGVMLKGLIALIVVGGGAFVYLAITGSSFRVKLGGACTVVLRNRNFPVDRRSLARHSNAANAALSGLDDAQCPRRVSRLLLVLFHERARLAFPESPLPSRLQHCSASGLLAITPGLAVSLERVFPGRRAPEL